MKLPRIPWRTLTSGRALPWVLAVVFLGTTLANWWLLHDDRRDDARTAAVTSTAGAFVHAFTNYHAETITQDVARIESYAIGDFASQLRTTFDKNAIDRIRTNKVSATGTTWNLALHDLGEGTAHVRSIVYETVATSGPPATTDVFQLDIELVRSGDAWKVDSVNANILQRPATPSG